MEAAEDPEEERRDGLEDTEKARLRSVPQQEEGTLLELDRAQRLRLERLERDPLRRDQIVDRASERLLRRMLSDDLPERPRAWFRKLVDRLIKSREVPYGKKHSQLDEFLNIAVVPATRDAANQQRRAAQAAWLRENQERFGLTGRERALLGAVLDHRSNRSAAKSLGMGVSNFRRDFGKLAEKISTEVRARFGENAPDFDPPPPPPS